MNDDSDAIYVHHQLDILESTAAFFGYFSHAIFTDNNIREAYENVCLQSSNTNPSMELYTFFQRNALFQLRIAEAQTMLQYMTGKKDSFNTERTKALNAISHIIPIERIITQFWNN